MGNMVLLNSGVQKRNNLSENNPRFGHAPAKRFASPVLGRKKVQITSVLRRQTHNVPRAPPHVSGRPWKHVSLMLVQNFILPFVYTALTKGSDVYRIVRGTSRPLYIARKLHLLPTRCFNAFIYVRSQNKAKGSPVTGLQHAKCHHFLIYHVSGRTSINHTSCLFNLLKPECS